MIKTESKIGDLCLITRDGGKEWHWYLLLVLEPISFNGTVIKSENVLYIASSQPMDFLINSLWVSGITWNYKKLN